MIVVTAVVIVIIAATQFLSPSLSFKLYIAAF